MQPQEEERNCVVLFNLGLMFIFAPPRRLVDCPDTRRFVLHTARVSLTLIVDHEGLWPSVAVTVAQISLEALSLAIPKLL
jgi:hypothetical protein